MTRTSVSAALLAPAALLLALALAPPRAAAADSPPKCHFNRIAELPITMKGMSPLIGAKVNGTEVKFILDTGAYHSMLSPDAAKRLGVHVQPAPQISMNGVGGRGYGKTGSVSEFTFAGVPLRRVEFVIGGPEFEEVGAVGLLGQNVLGIADVEYDLGHGVVRMFKAQDCPTIGLAYWAGKDAQMIRIEPASTDDIRIAGTVMINGKPVKAVFDTGATTTLLSLEAAARLGIRPGGREVVAKGQIEGVGEDRVDTWNAPIASFSIGDEDIHDTVIRIGKLEQMDAEMLLGADFFLSHRILVAHSQHRLYFTYNGGPVFRAQ